MVLIWIKFHQWSCSLVFLDFEYFLRFEIVIAVLLDFWRVFEFCDVFSEKHNLFSFFHIAKDSKFWQQLCVIKLLVKLHWELSEHIWSYFRTRYLIIFSCLRGVKIQFCRVVMFEKNLLIVWKHDAPFLTVLFFVVAVFLTRNRFQIFDFKSKITHNPWFNRQKHVWTIF